MVGDFQLVDRAGRGGMAEVWRARHVSLGTPVAVKIMTGSMALDSRYRDRFVREVQAVARFDHPGIVRVFDYGEADDEAAGVRRGAPYLIMELADRGVLEPEGVGSYSVLRRVVLQLLDALAYSHARGVIHRDLKPANVLLVSDGPQVRAKLTDFGIAHADDPDTDVTRGTLSETAGTPDYMPPEQLQAQWREYGPWTDLYALGCMIWELTTGTVPFTGPNRIQVALKHMSEEPPALKARFAVPPEFEEWLRRLLAKKPFERFTCAADAAFALSRMSAPAQEMWSQPNSDLFSTPDTGGIGLDSSSWEDDDATLISSAGALGLGSESSAALEAVEDATTVLAFNDVAMLLEQAPSTSNVPPIPPTWRAEETKGETHIGLGMGLFGLREVPFVDRVSERDSIWQALREVGSSGRPRAIVLRGPSGVGKSRLAQWVTRRAQEVGAATLLYAPHSSTVGAQQGASKMLERFFVTWQMERRESVAAHVRERLERMCEHSPESADMLDHESRALATIALGPVTDSGGAEFRFAGPEERVATLARFVSRVACERPVVLWLDDVQWGAEAVALAERLLEERSAPVLVLLTVQDEAVPLGSPMAARLDAVQSLPSSEVLRLRRLQEDDQRELLRRLLPLDDGTATLVAQATAGNPLFAVQVITDWVEQNVLVPGPRGFQLSERANITTNFHGLWIRRVNRVAERHGGLSQRLVIELAATLGNDVVEVEWQACCIVANLEADERLVEELVEQGLAVRSENGWSFVHRTLADSVRQAARGAGRWQALNNVCADVLQTLYPHAPAMLPRIADHLIEAQAWEEALVPLGDLARAYIAMGELAEAAERLQMRMYAMDALELGTRDPRRAENRLLEASVHMLSGSPEHAERTLGEVVQQAEQHGWPHVIARAYRVRGELRASDGRLREALSDFEVAERYMLALADPNEHAALFENRAWALKALGDTAAARSDLERALDLYRESGDKLRELNVFSRLAHTFLAEGDVAASREVAEMGIELCRQSSNRQAEAGCLTTLGEIERSRGDLGRARECFAEAERLDVLCGSRHVWVVRAQDAISEIAAGEWKAAAGRLDAIFEGLVSVGYGWMLPLVSLARACCAGRSRNWHAWDDAWDAAVREIDQKHLRERDIAWLAELAGFSAEDGGDAARARRAVSYAADQWEVLGDAWRARELRIKLRSIGR